MLIKNPLYNPLITSPNGEKIVFFGTGLTAETITEQAASFSGQGINIMSKFNIVKFNSDFFDLVGGIYKFKHSGLYNVRFSIQMTSSFTTRIYLVSSNDADNYNSFGIDTGISTGTSLIQPHTISNTVVSGLFTEGSHMRLQARMVSNTTITLYDEGDYKQKASFVVTMQNLFS